MAPHHKKSIAYANGTRYTFLVIEHQIVDCPRALRHKSKWKRGSGPLINPRKTESPLLLEPWGERYSIAAGAAIEVIAEGTATDTLEVALEDGSMVVWGWPGSNVRLICGDVELGDSQRRPAVPGGAE